MTTVYILRSLVVGEKTFTEEQLLQEGVIQVFHLKDAATRVPLLGAVGPLQFEVVQYRLQSEYGLERALEMKHLKIMGFHISLSICFLKERKIDQRRK